ncbi:MAG TPA: fumarylacetoacetate hydrolase family protein [Acidobacteriaceae bacterium]|nr:fumarylacetoacetate hydrolase family protein [Acidobacteriaceae bacterium]
MKYCRLQTRYGAQYGEVIDRNGRLWVERLIPPFEEGPVSDAVEPAGTPFEPLPFEDAQLLTPVAPSKIVCVGRNYREHAAELGNEVPAEPLLFFKPPSALLSPGQAIRIPELSKRVDFEGEIAIVIGAQCSKIGPDQDPDDYIRGYTLANDVTARDLQKKDGQWTRAKGFDTFCPVGPLVTDEVDPAAGISITTRLNGELRQDGNTRDFIFPIDHLLRYITAAMTLFPGDLILTGTPAGVAPMRSGDQVAVRVEGIGTLTNFVA